ncbi:hypothetical protein [Microbacterium sp. XT11]|uniref:hypothetical protein n=1 Tax=Microbacterium sp. XT11 TaxID=367477 RepID=UPI00082B63C0|nr:hypothetical protein [Microbacterium sp. XT11]
MDSQAELALNVVLAITSAVGAGIAIWQAVVAKGARDDAEVHARRALEIAERQSAAQEAIAARLKPAPWSDLINVSGQLYATKNTSGEALTITNVSVTPDSAFPMFKPRTPIPSTLQPGDAFRAMLVGRYGLAIDTVVVEWTAASGETGTTRLAKP